MAKRYKNLYDLWEEQEKDFSIRAITEIGEMLSAMGIKRGERFNIDSTPFASGFVKRVVSVEVKGSGDDVCLGVIYIGKENDSVPFGQYYGELTISPGILSSIHYCIRKDYNKFVRTHKAIK